MGHPTATKGRLAMKRSILLVSLSVCMIFAGTLLVAPATEAGSPGYPPPGYPPSPPIYNPYPPGILPSDISPEEQRIQTEIQGIFEEGITQWQGLPPLTYTSNPPILQGSGYQAVETLGKLMNFDLNISPFKNTACASCHMPYAGFSGPIPSVNLTMIAYPGSEHYRAAKRTAQRYTYSPDFPVLEYNATVSQPGVTALFFGGNFWDGRATGYELQSPDAEQAQHPPVDPLEMGNPDTACIAYKLSQAVYRPLFEEIWGDSFDIRFPYNTGQICTTPNGAAIFNGSTTPVQLSPSDRTKANNIYNHWAQSISFYERSTNVSAFTSKFDAFLAGNYTMTSDEAAGYALFNGKGNCNSCHLDGVSTTLTSSQTDTGTNSLLRPLFTCFGYANEGLPLNPRIALFYETTPDFFGYTPNPYGFGYRDLGFGNFLRSGFGSGPIQTQTGYNMLL
jgi:cytochrome c peroxidase